MNGDEPTSAAAGRPGVSERVLTLPNVLSTLRLLVLPVFLWAIIDERDLLAVAILVLSGFTDYLDGKIARTFAMESRVGAFLDPVADRLYILTTLGGLVWRGIIPLWLVAVLLGREVVMALMLLYLRSRGQTGLPVHFVGKAATFNLISAFPILLLGHQPGAVGEVALPIGWALMWWGVSLYWLSTALYALQARSVLAQRSGATP